MGGFYLLGAWLVLQVSDVLSGILGLPDWTLRLISLLLLLGLPLVLVLAWIYQWTPEGLKKEEEPSITEGNVRITSIQQLILLLTSILFVVGGYWLIEYFVIQGRDIIEPTLAPTAPPRTQPVIFAVMPNVIHSGNDITDKDKKLWQDFVVFEFSKWPDVQTIRYPRVARLASRYDSPSTLANELGASHIIQAEVWNEEGESRFDFMILDAESNKKVWVKSFDAPFFINAEPQDSGLIEFNFELNTFLTNAGLSENKIETESLTAYEAWWIGATKYNESDDLALRWFKEAVLIDQNYVQAWNDIAKYWVVKANSGQAWSELREQAFEAGNKALELGPDNANAHANMSRIMKLESLNSSGEERSIAIDKSLEYGKRAVELAPRNVSIREDYVRALFSTRDWNEVISQLDIIVTYRPDAHYLRDWGLSPRVWAGRLDEAESYLSEMKQAYPDGDWDYTEGAFTLHRAKGRPMEALEALHPDMKLAPTVWSQDYIDLLLDIGALNAIESWSEHLDEINDGYTHNFVWSAVFSTLGYLGKAEQQLSYIDRLSTSIISAELKQKTSFISGYGHVLRSSLEIPEVKDRLAELNLKCEAFKLDVNGEAFELNRQAMFDASRCYTLARIMRDEDETLAQVVIDYFNNRGDITLSPPGTRNTYDRDLVNLILIYAILDRIDDAVNELRKLYGQGFSRPYIFESAGVIEDLHDIYNDFGKHPEFLEIYNELKMRNANIRQEITEEAPWLLDPTLDSQRTINANN